MHIRFEKVFETARFLSPLANMAVVEEQIERRRDPLTGRWSVFASCLKGKAQVVFGPTDHGLLARLAERSRKGCFFCPERLEGATPRYTDDVLPGGSIRVGDCVLFPNLFPVSAVHAIIVVGSAHFRGPGEFDAPLLKDALDAAARCARAFHARDPAKRFFTVNANYMHPAGASAVHPHFQLAGSEHAATAVERLAQDCRRFKEEHGRDYFSLLAAEEEGRGERFVGSTGPVDWLVPFAPMGVNEVLGVVRGRADLPSLDEAALTGLALGLSRTLAYYGRAGFSAFNFTLYSPAAGGAGGAFPVHLRAICRQNVYENYRSDDHYLQKLLGEQAMLFPPEEVAAGLRAAWEERRADP